MGLWLHQFNILESIDNDEEMLESIKAKIRAILDADELELAPDSYEPPALVEEYRQPENQDENPLEDEASPTVVEFADIGFAEEGEGDGAS